MNRYEKLKSDAVIAITEQGGDLGKAILAKLGDANVDVIDREVLNQHGGVFGFFAVIPKDRHEEVITKLEEFLAIPGDRKSEAKKLYQYLESF